MLSPRESHQGIRTGQTINGHKNKTSFRRFLTQVIFFEKRFLFFFMISELSYVPQYPSTYHGGIKSIVGTIQVAQPTYQISAQI